MAVLSLALGIGANTAIFSMINGILYKSLPVRDPHELRVINWTCDPTHNWPMMRNREGGFGHPKSNMLSCGSFPYPAYQDFAEQAEGFSDIFAFSSWNPHGRQLYLCTSFLLTGWKMGGSLSAD